VGCGGRGGALSCLRDAATRRIIYDLTELEGAARLKKGETERTDKKVANVNKWFVKLDTDLATLLSYFA